MEYLHLLRNYLFYSFRLMPLPGEEILCPICMDPPENAVECVECHNFFCEKCVKQQNSCPLCKAQPLKIQINVALRRLVERMRVPCEFCNTPNPKGEVQTHKKNCPKRPRTCSIGNCQFSSNNEAQAISHFTASHKDFIWDHFENFQNTGNVIIFNWYLF